MTARQIDDVAFINNPNQWVHWPYLPVKSYHRKKPDGFPTVGIVVESGNKVLPTVFLANGWIVD